MGSRFAAHPKNEKPAGPLNTRAGGGRGRGRGAREGRGEGELLVLSA